MTYATTAVNLLTKTILTEINKEKALPKTEESKDENIEILGIAYYNMGIEFEHLKEYTKAIEIYEKGLKILDEKGFSANFVYTLLSKALINSKNQLSFLPSCQKDTSRSISLGITRQLCMPSLDTSTTFKQNQVKRLLFPLKRKSSILFIIL